MPTPALPLHDFHASLGARFGTAAGCEVVDDYGDIGAEHSALTRTAAVTDLSFRGRLCVTGADRQSFLNGQVTNNVRDLKPGTGCYAAIVNAKGRMQSDANILALAGEVILDFEPGLTATLAQRLQKYVIAEDVQIVEIEPQYGLLSVQGPCAAEVVRMLGLVAELPASPFASASVQDQTLGELCLANLPRLGTSGFDIFAPHASLGAIADKLIAAARSLGGRACGWRAWETARIEAGLPRYGVDMDETNLPPETGIEARAVDYRKGCYIGQEVIARLRTYGRVAKALRGLRLADDLPTLPVHGDKLFHGGREVGQITSAVRSPVLQANIALGYVRRECNQPGTELLLRAAAGGSQCRIAELPFVPPRYAA